MSGVASSNTLWNNRPLWSGERGRMSSTVRVVLATSYLPVRGQFVLELFNLALCDLYKPHVRGGQTTGVGPLGVLRQGGQRPEPAVREGGHLVLGENPGRIG